MPQDISVYKVCRVKPDAHARFDATARTYKYYITTVKFPFNRQYRYRIHNPLDFQKMNEAALTLFHYSDFTSFSKLHTDVKPIFVRLCMPNGLRRMNIPGCLPSRQTALRNMVRAIVGTLLEVGRGKLSVDDFRKIIEQQNRCKAGTSAPEMPSSWLM